MDYLDRTHVILHRDICSVEKQIKEACHAVGMYLLDGLSLQDEQHVGLDFVLLGSIDYGKTITNTLGVVGF